VNSGIGRIQIFGERCSGTNFLRLLLQENIESVPIRSDFGWKHSFHQTDLEGADDCLFVVVCRNPFDWVRSLHRRPYHAGPTLKRIPFSEFIRREWWCVWDEDARKAPDDEVYGTEMMSERNPETGERFPDVLRMRTAKIRNWQSLADKVPHSEFVRYEDLAAAPAAFIDSLAGRFGLSRNPTFRPIEGRRGGERKFQPRQYAPIRKRDIAHIVGRLDVPLESRVGYDVPALAADPRLRSSIILWYLRKALRK
jgi:hypothetical protein